MSEPKKMFDPNDLLPQSEFESCHKCDFCEMRTKHVYDNLNLCILHYLIQNRHRNYGTVLNELTYGYVHKKKDRFIILREMVKTVDVKEMDEYIRCDNINSNEWYWKSGIREELRELESQRDPDQVFPQFGNNPNHRIKREFCNRRIRKGESSK